MKKPGVCVRRVPKMSPIWVGVISSTLNIIIFMDFKKKRYRHESLLRVTVFVYSNPVILHPVPTGAHWYKEGKILYSDKVKAVGYLNGYKVEYSVKMYFFRRVKEVRLPVLVRYMRIHSYRYPGMISHCNLYGGISKRFIKQVKLQLGCSYDYY